MNNAFQIKWLYAFIIGFLIINGILVYNEIYFLFALPLVLIVSWLFVKRLDVVLFITTFCTPLSVIVDVKEGGLSLSLPTEPLMIISLGLFVLKLMIDGSIDKKIIKHPITIAITLSLIWMTITSITSSMPLVSFKFLLARLWFVIPFYFFATILFKDFENIKRFIWLSIIPLAGVALYTLIQHAMNGFNEESAHWVMTPFYNDHTSYGAMLAFFFPALIGFIMSKETSQGVRISAGFMFAFYIIAIIFSYTRAAWVSLIVALLLYILLLLKVRFRTLIFVASAAILILVLNMNKLLLKLDKNRQDSSNNLTEHVQSISNVTTDASNLERLNRWSSAMRMFFEKPYFGWGPGTYMFKYAPFQLAKDKTIISTNAADGGNAHSEYIGPLAEQGVLGAISILSIVLVFFATSFKLYFKLEAGSSRMYVLVCFLGLVTYFIHGALNNFLDTDKAAVPVWGFMAIIAAIDIYHSNKKTDIPEINN